MARVGALVAELTVEPEAPADSCASPATGPSPALDEAAEKAGGPASSAGACSTSVAGLQESCILRARSPSVQEKYTPSVLSPAAAPAWMVQDCEPRNDPDRNTVARHRASPFRKGETEETRDSFAQQGKCPTDSRRGELSRGCFASNITDLHARTGSAGENGTLFDPLPLVLENAEGGERPSLVFDAGMELDAPNTRGAVASLATSAGRHRLCRGGSRHGQLSISNECGQDWSSLLHRRGSHAECSPSGCPLRTPGEPWLGNPSCSSLSDNPSPSPAVPRSAKAKRPPTGPTVVPPVLLKANGGAVNIPLSWLLPRAYIASELSKTRTTTNTRTRENLREQTLRPTDIGAVRESDCGLQPNGAGCDLAGKQFAESACRSSAGCQWGPCFAAEPPVSAEAVTLEIGGVPSSDQRPRANGRPLSSVSSQRRVSPSACCHRTDGHTARSAYLSDHAERVRGRDLPTLENEALGSCDCQLESWEGSLEVEQLLLIPVQLLQEAVQRQILQAHLLEKWTTYVAERTHLVRSRGEGAGAFHGCDEPSSSSVLLPPGLARHGSLGTPQDCTSELANAGGLRRLADTNRFHCCAGDAPGLSPVFSKETTSQWAGRSVAGAGLGIPACRRSLSSRLARAYVPPTEARNRAAERDITRRAFSHDASCERLLSSEQVRDGSSRAARWRSTPTGSVDRRETFPGSCFSRREKGSSDVPKALASDWTFLATLGDPSSKGHEDPCLLPSTMEPTAWEPEGQHLAPESKKGETSGSAKGNDGRGPSRIQGLQYAESESFGLSQPPFPNGLALPRSPVSRRPVCRKKPCRVALTGHAGALPGDRLMRRVGRLSTVAWHGLQHGPRWALRPVSRTYRRVRSECNAAEDSAEFVSDSDKAGETAPCSGFAYSSGSLQTRQQKRVFRRRTLGIGGGWSTGKAARNSEDAGQDGSHSRFAGIEDHSASEFGTPSSLNNRATRRQQREQSIRANALELLSKAVVGDPVEDLVGVEVGPDSGVVWTSGQRQKSRQQSARDDNFFPVLRDTLVVSCGVMECAPLKPRPCRRTQGSNLEIHCPSFCLLTPAR